MRFIFVVVVFRYDTENHIHQSEEGNLKEVGNEVAVAVSGSYEYLGPKGEKVSVVYVADENGYKPKVLISLLKAAALPPSPKVAPKVSPKVSGPPIVGLVPPALILSLG